MSDCEAGFKVRARHEVRSEAMELATSLVYESPYEDVEAKKHQWHAVYQNRSHGDGLHFMSANTKEDLAVGLSSLNDIKRVVAVYNGFLIDFHEERHLTFKAVSPS